MNPSKLEEAKENLLQRLKEVSEEGISKSNLCGSSKGNKDALAALVKDRKVFNLGSRSRPCFVLEKHFRPLERAYEAIEQLFNSVGLKLMTKGKLEKELKTFSAVKKKISEALELLVQENKLLKFKTAGYFSYTGVKPILDMLNQSTVLQEPTPVIDEEEYKKKIQEAYQKLTGQSGFSAVEIYQLHIESGIPLDWIKEFIVKLRREGKAEFNFGDWSLSSEETRSGAVEFDGDRFLLVRLLSIGEQHG